MIDRGRRAFGVGAVLALTCALGSVGRAQATAITLPALEVDATTPLAVGRIEIGATCVRVPASRTIACELNAAYRIENPSDAIATAGFSTGPEARIDCRARRVSECDAIAIPPGDSITVTVRSSHRLDLAFERRWTRDRRLALFHPHASAPPGAARHPLVGADRGPGELATLRIVVARPTGVSSDATGPIPIRFGGRFTTTDYDALAFGENEVTLVDGSVRTGVVGGPTFFLGGERKSGFGGRVGYEVGFGRWPFTFDLSFEGAQQRGPGVSGTFFVFSPSMAGLGAGFGIGPALRVDDRAHLGTRLTFDVSIVVDLRATLTFEPGEPMSLGLYVGGAL